MMDRADVAELLAFLVAAFPRTVIGKETLDLYTLALSDADTDHATRAVTKLALRGRGFPTLQELRDEIANYSGNGVPDLDRAWGEVMQAVSKYGAYREPSFTHPAIAAAVNAITWREICATTEIGVLRGQFTKCYEASKRREADPLHTQLVEKFTGAFASRRATRLLGSANTPAAKALKP